MIKNLYQYRELLKSSVKKEIRGKYKNSFLGVIWSFLNPLLQIEYDKTYYIPINSNFIKNVDLQNKQIIVENIEGLII